MQQPTEKPLKVNLPLLTDSDLDLDLKSS